MLFNILAIYIPIHTQITYSPTKQKQKYLLQQQLLCPHKTMSWILRRISCLNCVKAGFPLLCRKRWS